MEESSGGSQPKLWFPARIRQLRIDANKKQREVAAAIGCAESTYANAESCNFKRLRMERVLKLARFYDLSPADQADLIAGWEALPASEFNTRNKPRWERRNARRAKAKAHDAMKRSLLEVISLLIGTVPDPDTLCSCTPPDMFSAPDEPPPDPCEVCSALQLLGLTGWTTQDEVLAKLSEIQDGMAR